jgi:pyruvate dehydrogenase E1 component
MNAAIDPRPASWLHTITDTDAQETQEWKQSLLAVLEAAGPERAKFLLDELVRTANSAQVGWRPELSTPYVNTISVDQQPVFPGDLAISRLV